MLISDAYAQAAAGAPDPMTGLIVNLAPLLLILAVFYFLLIRPQMKRQKEHKAMIDALEKGHEVVTAGGVVGRITELGDQYLTLQVASVNGQPVEISVQRAAVQLPLPKGTMKSL